MPPPRRSIDLTEVVEWQSGVSRRCTDEIASEEPLEIQIGDEPFVVTMRTPGHDLELAAGFLFTEGIVNSREQILSLGHFPSSDGSAAANTVRAELVPSALSDLTGHRRNSLAFSACGVCGKTSIDSVRHRALIPLDDSFRFSPRLLCDLPGRLRGAQAVFGRTGGLHGCAVFDAAGKLLAAREDIGRHNAVDKVVGWALREGRIPLREHVLLVSGRGGFEIVQKAIVAGIPVLASVSAPSGLAVRLARELHLTLAGFLRGERFVLYSGEERLLPDATSMGRPVFARKTR